MQRSEEIDVSALGDIVTSIFQENAIAYEDYSTFDSDLKKYENAELVLEAIEQAIQTNTYSVNFAVYYPDAQGYFFKEKRELDPKKCNGATFRYEASGWGLVHLQIDLRAKPIVGVTLAVNSEKRAQAWASTCPEFKDPSEWDWKYIERQARRVIRVLRKCA